MPGTHWHERPNGDVGHVENKLPGLMNVWFEVFGFGHGALDRLFKMATWHRWIDSSSGAPAAPLGVPYGQPLKVNGPSLAAFCHTQMIFMGSRKGSSQ